MLTIELVLTEHFDEVNETFEPAETMAVCLEHSLSSLSKWEQCFEVPFLTTEKTPDQIIAYIQMMVVEPSTIGNSWVEKLTPEHIEQINKYINAKATATWFSESSSKSDTPKKKEVITSELIYYWMISAGVPFECQHWHLKRLLTLLRVCSIKNAPTKKTNRRDLASRNRMLNAQRKARLGTTG